MTAHCHKLLRKTAQEMAGALYEHLATDDVFYRLNPSQKHFINTQWPRLLDKARATLAQMLSGNYPDSLKAQIHEALILDNALRRGRMGRVGA